MADDQPTLRMVLRLEAYMEEGQPENAWHEVGTAHGSKKQAIEKFVGKDGKEKPGTYRAPSLRSWKGEYTFEADPEPKMKTTVKD